MELFGASEDSYFDKYLNEVLYLFRHSGADAIVFEDLDRYNVTLIFEKLREINDLLRRAEERERGSWQNRLRKRLGKAPRGVRSIRFFYLIRDDVFTSADRSKFFDFIIPVVPVIDAGNSCQMLLNSFQEAGISDRFHKRFLQDISLYLSDMRMVTNIVNEYIVYDERLKQKQLPSDQLRRDPDCQLAMVIYKNLYPGDFDRLHSGRGYVHEIFEKRTKLLEERREELEAEIGELTETGEAAEKVLLDSLDELNAAFFSVNEHILSVDGTDAEDMSRPALVKALLGAQGPVYYQTGAYARSTELPLENIAEAKKKMEADPEYQRLAEAIQNRGEKERRQRKERLDGLRKQLTDLELMNLRELLEEAGSDKDFWDCRLPAYEPAGYVEDIRNGQYFQLLQYLIRNGYLNENYASYMGYFYPGSLTVNDKNFLLALANHTCLEYRYHLDMPEEVLERLQLVDFARREIYNFDLFEYLLVHDRLAQLTAWLKAIEERGYDDAYEFPLEFWRTGRQKGHFLQHISRLRPRWFFQWYDWGFFREGEWCGYALDLFDRLDEKTLASVNEDGWLTEAISNDPLFLQIDDPHTEKILSAFRLLNVQFSALSCREEDRKLAEAAYQGGFYGMTAPILDTWLEMFWGVSGAVEQGKSYTYLRQKSDEPLCRRVQEDPDGYVEAILGQSAPFSDEEDAALELLNNAEIALDNRTAYARRLDTAVSQLKQVQETALWPALLEKGCVLYSWENIADYFVKICGESGEISGELAEFINGGDKKLAWSFDALNGRLGRPDADRLRGALIRCEQLSLERYETAIRGLTTVYSNFHFENLPDTRIRTLIKLGIPQMTAKNVGNIRENYPRCLNDFFLRSQGTDLVKLVKSGQVQLEQNELEALLQDSRLSKAAARDLMDAAGYVLTLEGKAYPAHVKAHIIQHHFDEDDINRLLLDYEEEDLQVQQAFSQYAAEHAEEVASAAEVEEKMPLELYAGCLETMSSEAADSLRKYLPDKRFEAVCTTEQRPAFEDTVLHRKLLGYFIDRGWISSFRADASGRLRAYPRRRT